MAGFFRLVFRLHETHEPDPFMQSPDITSALVLIEARLAAQRRKLKAGPRLSA